MKQFFVGLFLIIALPWTFFAYRGCSAKMEDMRAELDNDRRAYEAEAAGRRAAALAKMLDADRQAEVEDIRRRERIIGELEARKAALAAETGRLEKAVELRTADRDFRRIVNGKLSAEYREYQMAGSELLVAENLLGEAAAVAEKAGTPLPDAFHDATARVQKAQSDLDRIGRTFREAAALLQIEETQFSP